MIDKRLKYKTGQRVKKSSTRKRPGYRGDDWGASAEADGFGANTGNNSGPTESYSVQDDLTDYATNVGKTANTTGGGFVGDDETPSLPPGVIPNTFVPKAPPKKKIGRASCRERV